MEYNGEMNKPTMNMSVHFPPITSVLDRITIKRGVVQALQEYCTQQLPQEGCGILAGMGPEISRFYPVVNQDESSQSYSFEPRSYIHALKEMRDSKLDWLGIVHSHPNTAAVPSSRDIQEWHHPELMCWILSIKEDPKLSAFLIRGGTFTPVSYQIVP
ncbi:Proteasome lid subunit RPN8/RPN11, contains Jab1/MPN metalloenzyme (JAMM) motif [Marininema mesophilum]|uniref:Proteasome lid subunit RPN8/RPN11, contains Jab1/MPN metalloenzyme (JAMM) motif n=1 Tax=Marininema mesophilum TaxID=1048340 RepID=A0A1H2YHC5_9BACL|nr:M67 family metallopeptidase [Marininema mesophilum]SDX04208.1 Proteasome lid subunit RPN8/RPN11, contains Jab1/MPN metalloenzyme (JAMM) motif [Marininema mesophilum]